MFQKTLSHFDAQRDEKYRHFLATKIKASSQPETILGIRMGVIRKEAKRLTKELTYSEAITLLHPLARQWYEYKLLFGLVTQKLVSTPDEARDLLHRLYPLCDGWAVPDLYRDILGSLARTYPTLILESIATEAKSPNPFARRLTAVAQMDLLRHHVTTPEAALRHLLSLQDDSEYLVQMGVAWALSEIELSLAPGLIATSSDSGLSLSNPQVIRYYQQKLRDSLRHAARKK